MNPPKFTFAEARRKPLYPLVLVIIFLVSTVFTYVNIPPRNHLDWVTTAQMLRYMTRLENPYSTHLTMDDDLRVYYRKYENLPYSPWSVFYLGILAYASTRLILALSVAAWMVVIIDIGRPSTLILLLHPTFLMLLASGNADFLINGLGLWLILRGVRGWRLGVAIMLLAIKPQVLPFLILLECARIAWERDGEAALTIAVIAGVSLALYPHWLDWPIDTIRGYIDVARGVKTSEDIKFGGGYPFSVFGAWGLLPALGVTLVLLLIMIRRRTEWRTLAILGGYVWTTYVNPYSYAVLLILFRRSPAWRTVLYLVLSLISLPFFFTEWHHYERYGILLFWLLAAVLAAPQTDQTEEAIAQRHHQPPLPLVRRFARSPAVE